MFAESFWARVGVADGRGCREWLKCRSPLGYGQVRYLGKRRPAHRVAYTLAFGAIPDDLCVLHRCDNRACCEPSHLFLGTQQDNIADMVTKGRQRGAVGARNPNAKLTPEDVHAIRAAHAAGEIQRVIAERYNVSRGMVGHIVRGVVWTHV